MKYNPFGYRFFSGKSNKDGDVFIYSSQGQLIGKYKISGNMLKLDFVPIYEGTKRIGIVERENVTWFDCPNFVGCPTDDIGVDAWQVAGLSIKESFLKADRKYELTDHLGNVRVVIANQRIPVDANGDSLVDYYKPLVKEISDYYPYGWVKFYGNYEFGANSGSLFEDWDSTKGTYYTLYRLLDARIARWYQVEPKIESYGTWSGYSYVFNNPVKSVDVLGLDTFIYERDKNGKWILKKIISSDDPIEHDGYFALPSGEKQEYARFIVRDDSGRIVSDEVIALKRVVNRGGTGWLMKIKLENKLIKGSWYELVGYRVDSVRLIPTGKIEPVFIELDILMGLSGLLRVAGAWIGFHGSKSLAKVLMKSGRSLEDILKGPVVASSVARGDYAEIPFAIVGGYGENLVRPLLNRAISNDVIQMSAQEYLKLKFELLKLEYNIIMNKIQSRQDNARVIKTIPIKPAVTGQ